MAGDDATDGWYVRARGRVLGPLTWPQLESLRDRGQLARFDEVSPDRQAWTAAGRLPRLFPQPSEAGRGQATSSRKAAPAAEVGEFIVLADDDADRAATPVRTSDEDDSEWYFARNRTHEGPVRLAQLQRMADGGEIGPATLIWTSGFEQWTPASQVDELRFPICIDALAAAQDDAGAAAPEDVRLPPRQAGNAVDPSHPPHRTSILAINSLIMGCLWLLGLGSLAAIGLGVTALQAIGRSQGMLTGKRLAIAGILVGLIGLALTLGLLLLPGFFSGSAP